MRRPSLPTLLGSLLLAALLVTTLMVWRYQPAPETPNPGSSSLSLAALMGGTPPAGFRRALPPADIRLPRDHGPHPGFRTEWWYFTGNVDAAEPPARRFGFQLTFFRSALAPPGQTPANPPGSVWAADHLFMAHFALTDLDGGRFHHFERFAREALGLAGAMGSDGPEDTPFKVWLGPWSATTVDAPHDGDIWPLRLRATDTDTALDLVVEPTQGPVLQGESGYSRKGKDPGNASYYYSFPRLGARGTVRTGDGEWAVQGDGWLDREWSTTALGEGQVGWDWFALQLDDGREVMLYQLREADGKASPYSAGSLVEADGTVRILHQADFTIEVLDHWRTPDGAVRYPGGWRLHLPDGLRLDVHPLLADQELRAAVRYWEGAVEVTGATTGRGYVELTGYADATVQDAHR